MVIVGDSVRLLNVMAPEVRVVFASSVITTVEFPGVNVPVFVKAVLEVSVKTRLLLSVIRVPLTVIVVTVAFWFSVMVSPAAMTTESVASGTRPQLHDPAAFQLPVEAT